MHEISDGTTASNSPQQETPSASPPLTDRISDALQNGVKAIIGSNRKPPRRFRSLLNGTWLGHPLHPAITDVPIGAWALAAVLDVIWLVSPGTNGWAAR